MSYRGPHISLWTITVLYFRQHVDVHLWLFLGLEGHLHSRQLLLFLQLEATSTDYFLRPSFRQSVVGSSSKKIVSAIYLYHYDHSCYNIIVIIIITISFIDFIIIIIPLSLFRLFYTSTSIPICLLPPRNSNMAN